MLSSFYHASSKRRQKRQSTKHVKQSEADITNEQYEEFLEQRKACLVPGRRYIRKQPSLERKFVSSVIAT